MPPHEIDPHPIDRVLGDLTSIVDWARSNRSRIGYFAAMYRRVTLRVKAAIEAGEFDDAERMTRLMVGFAGRYIDAFGAFRAGRRTTQAWDVSLSAAARWRPVVVQQLLTGMNAHINLDLGIAAATASPGAELASLERDFDLINDILASMVEGLVADVGEVSPWFGLLDRLGGRTDRVLIAFSIDKARDAAWTLATDLASIDDRAGWATPIEARDEWAAGFGRLLLSPGWLMNVVLLIVRIREGNRVVRVIDALTGA